VFNSIEGIRIKTICERVIDQKVGHGEEPQFVRILRAIALKSTEVIGIAKARAMVFENPPIPFCPLRADFLDEMVFEIGSNAIIVEQCVIHIEQKHETGFGR